MKKFITLAITFYITQSLFAQTTSNHSVGAGLGHEWNVFLNPSYLESEEEELDRFDLWDNGTFQSLSSRNSWKIEKGEHRLKLVANGSLGIYQTQNDANRFEYYLKASYRTKYSSKKYFEFAPEYQRLKREGVNIADAVLRTPFSFGRLYLPLHFDFYMGNKMWVKTQVGYLYKHYDRMMEEEALVYKSPFATVSFSKKWVGSSVQKLTFNSGLQLRTYEELEFDSDGELEEKTRNWNFLRNSVEFSNKKESRSITFGLYEISRLDQSQTNTYHEASPGVKWSSEFGKIGIDASLRYSYRYYPGLTPGEDNDDLQLVYQYIRTNVKMTYEVTSKIQGYTKLNVVDRLSNNPDPAARGFRGYFNSLVETGLTYKFK